MCIQGSSNKISSTQLQIFRGDRSGSQTKKVQYVEGSRKSMHLKNDFGNVFSGILPLFCTLGLPPPPPPTRFSFFGGRRKLRQGVLYISTYYDTLQIQIGNVLYVYTCTCPASQENTLGKKPQEGTIAGKKFNRELLRGRDFCIVYFVIHFLWISSTKTGRERAWTGMQAGSGL